MMHGQPIIKKKVAVCSQIHTKHINTLCGRNVELLSVKLVVYIATTGVLRYKARKLINYFIPPSLLHVQPLLSFLLNGALPKI